MARTNGRPKVDEFGDFQTPVGLATQVCQLLARRGEIPASVVEPTCGVGNFLLPALDRFPTVRAGIAVDVKRAHVVQLSKRLHGRANANRITVAQQSFFDVDWNAAFRDLPEPILVVGNPPWVTNTALGVIESANLPKKSNFHERAGLEALTGKSNFDISEWMLITLLEALDRRRATLAMLCKTVVARKVLAHAWKKGFGLSDAEIHPIDAATHFDAAVDACLLICRLRPNGRRQACGIYGNLGDSQPVTLIGYHESAVIADVAAFERWKHLAGAETFKWRSGVKHDCSKVMELRREGRRFRNGLGELVDLESEYLYPMLKSSQIKSGRSAPASRWMLVTQRAVGDDTALIRERAPKTWAYLLEHGELLDRRASAIYRGRPRFAVFGVGDYTFSPWKVAISGFYKSLEFSMVPPGHGKPVVLDDTCYFLPCQDEPEARSVASLLNSEPARGFFSAFIFWDAKRPITVETLRRLDLAAVARELGR
jgi:hypothetical protein